MFVCASLVQNYNEKRVKNWIKNNFMVSNSSEIIPIFWDTERMCTDNSWFVDARVLWPMMSSITALDIILRGDCFFLLDTLLQGRPRACMNLREHTNEWLGLERGSCSHTHIWISLQTSSTDLDCGCCPGIYYISINFSLGFVLETGLHLLLQCISVKEFTT